MEEKHPQPLDRSAMVRVNDAVFKVQPIVDANANGDEEENRTIQFPIKVLLLIVLKVKEYFFQSEYLSTG